MKDNLDAVEQRMVSIAAQFDLVRDEVDRWEAKYEGKKPFEAFKKYVCFDWLSIQFLIERLFRCLQEEFAKLSILKRESRVRQVVDFEHEKGTIAQIIENIEQARIQFVVSMSFGVRRSISQGFHPRS